MPSIQPAGILVNRLLNQFELKSSITVISIEAFAEFLTKWKATKEIDDLHSTTIIQIGQPQLNRLKTESHFIVGQENIKVILHHSSYNFGIEADGENVNINLDGEETKIPKNFFLKEKLDSVII